MDDIKKQIVDRLKQASNILVTVRNNPTVDLLSACIGLALVLDKMDKHAAAVFSGEIPSTIEFLQPETTIEQTPDSLRDFIIALDKSKADKLRYKVEDKVVRIFITPYKTSLSEKDLEFSQGDFNVEAVIALGVHEQQELDQAITTHGRILHDATLISINNTPDGNLGALNWLEIGASSISEMVTELAMDLHKDAFDQQIATALLTGIVAETDRFSNDKTTPRTMNMAGQLMAAGANQQLVATSLQQPATSSPTVSVAVDSGDTPAPTSMPVPEPAASSAATDDGTLAITHDQQEDEAPSTESAPAHDQGTPEPAEETDSFASMMPPAREILPTPAPEHPEDAYTSPLLETPSTPQYEETPLPPRSYLADRPMVEPVSPLPIPPEPSNVNPSDVPSVELPAPILTHEPTAPPIAADVPALPPLPSPMPTMPGGMPSAPSAGQTLDALEKATGSFHQADAAAPVVPPAPDDNSVDAARGQVLNAFQDEAIPRPTSRIDLNAAPLGGGLHTHTDNPQVAAQPDPQQAVSIDHVTIDHDGNLSPDQAAPATPAPLPSAPADPSAGMPSLPQAPTTPPPITLFRP